MAIITMDAPFQNGDIVYLATDPEQKPRMVIGVLVRATHVSFELVCGEVSTWHLAIEITATKNVLAAL